MRTKRIIVLALSVIFAMGMLSVYAAGYELTVYSGNGQFGSGDRIKGSSVEVDAEKATVSVDGGDAVTITMPDKKSAADSKYFVRGIKLTGHDNDEVIAGPVDLNSASSPVKGQDASVVIAYGMKSNMTKYIVRYVDASDGSDLLDAETHYGVSGDKPIVSYKYVDGYLPNTWNETGRIAADGSTVFTFLYYEVDDEGNIITINDGAEAGAAGAGAGAGAAGAANAAAGTNLGDNAVPLADGPRDIVDIDDNSTPQSESPEGIEDSETPKAGLSGGAIAGIAAAAIALAAAGYAIIRRRSEYEYEDDDDEE